MLSNPVTKGLAVRVLSGEPITKDEVLDAVIDMDLPAILSIVLIPKLNVMDENKFQEILSQARVTINNMRIKNPDEFETALNNADMISIMRMAIREHGNKR